jgi:hypothetical protein
MRLILEHAQQACATLGAVHQVLRLLRIGHLAAVQQILCAGLMLPNCMGVQAMITLSRARASKELRLPTQQRCDR